MNEIDLVLFSRDTSPPRREVAEAVEAQQGVRVRVHRVIGARRPSDVNRVETIARARNEARAVGTSPFLLFLDDDVILDRRCALALLNGLGRRPEFAALAADYLGQSAGPWGGPDWHIGMGATMFRRSALEQIRFRWEPGKCECRCCCDDLRRLGMGIAYLPEATARHEPRRHVSPSESAAACPTVTKPLGQERTPRDGRVLAAFNHRHFRKFSRVFLGSLRASGNREPVTVIGYGLYPSEQRILAQTPGVDLLRCPDDGVAPPIRRLRDFQTAVARWPEDTPVAYWDAADVLFQGRLTKLWDLVRAHPDRLLAVREPTQYPENTAVANWTLSIRDRVCRRHAFELLSKRPFLNSGFAAATARSMLTYLREADRLLHSPALAGTSDWGDQAVLNLYCHSDPTRWLEISEAWNYCVFARRRGEIRTQRDGRIVAASGTPIHVAHGNAKSLTNFGINIQVGQYS